MGTDLTQSWDVLVITAADEAQAAAYDRQLEKRRALGGLRGFDKTLAVPDPGGARIGSGGSTLLAISRVLECLGCATGDAAEIRQTLAAHRVLIVHGGGDSRRLPCYGPAGKVFLPLPSDRPSGLPPTLFERLLPVLQPLPAPPGGGHVVVSSGDVLLEFDAETVAFAASGVTGLACGAPPETVARHGAYAAAADGEVLRFLQKPAPALQRTEGMLDNDGLGLLDIGVMSLAPDACTALLEACAPCGHAERPTSWIGPLGGAVAAFGLDFYTEVCCALGTGTSFEAYREAVRAAGSRFGEQELRLLYNALRDVEFHVHTLPECGFMHLGSLRHLVAGGCALAQRVAAPGTPPRAVVNTVLAENARIEGEEAWVEGCAISSTLVSGGETVVVGLDAETPFTLPRGACLDIAPGRDEQGRPFFCLRLCHVDENPKATREEGATWCGIPLADLPALAEIDEESLYPADMPPSERSLWHARVHPEVAGHGDYASWTWLFEPASAGPACWNQWRAAPRRSMADMARLLDHGGFARRREYLNAARVLPRMIAALGGDEAPAAHDLDAALTAAGATADGLAERFLELVREFGQKPAEQAPGSLKLAHALHTLGTVAEQMAVRCPSWVESWREQVTARASADALAWLEHKGLLSGSDAGHDWARALQREAFAQLRLAVVLSAPASEGYPRNCLRTDEIVWGRAPARLDLAGGWTDTPPYSLERGGCVLNAAVNLNGQPPIQAYGRVIEEPVIRLTSIDQGARVEVCTLAELQDCRSPAIAFALPKAVLLLSGFSPGAAPWPSGATLESMLRSFGGGIELTTLAAVPHGSGLGTSSIMAAVLLAIVYRIMGRSAPPHALLHDVLRVEQEITTGGGWQDQTGGVTPGVKMIVTAPGLVPEPTLRPVPGALLDPGTNGGKTLLYYTGITRVAKNILEHVVARYLDRDRAVMAALERIRVLPAKVARAMERGDPVAFGKGLAAAWALKQELDPGASNPEIDLLFERVAPFVHGAKIMGAGGGGFMLLACKSPEAAHRVRETLESQPPNPRARFFDMHINTEGLVVTVC